jgi:hypothetical protein
MQLYKHPSALYSKLCTEEDPMRVSTRNTGIAGIVAGLGYIVQAVMGLIKPQTEVFSGTSDYVLEAVFIIALVATIFGLIGLHSFAQNRYGRAGLVGFWLAVIGTGLMTVSAIATLFAGANSLGYAFLSGVLLTLIGYIILGIMTLRGKVLPLWGGLALILGFPLSVFLSMFGGGVLLGLAWLGVGYFLSKQ